MKKDCQSCKYEYLAELPFVCPCDKCESATGKPPSHWEPAEHYEPDTKADRIRAMSDEEMADFFAQHDMIILRKALAVFEAEDIIPENALTELRKDMLEALQQPAEEVDK